jgi:hypothetical protein
MTFPPIWKKCADAKYNGDFIGIETYSGYTLEMADPDATEYLLEPDVSDEILGQAVLDALKQSRFLPLEEAKALRLNIEKNYADWIKKLMIKYGYKTKRALFKNMKSCGIECHEDIITIRPSHHEKLEGWGGTGISPDSYVKIPADAMPAEVGAGLRLAFSRCTG